MKDMVWVEQAVKMGAIKKNSCVTISRYTHVKYFRPAYPWFIFYNDIWYNKGKLYVTLLPAPQIIWSLSDIQNTNTQWYKLKL